MPMLFAFWMPSTPEMIILLIVGLLLFGGRLPEVGKSLGKSLIEFRKGLRGLKDDVGLGELDNVRREMRDLAHGALADTERQVHDYGEVVDTEAKPAGAREPEEAAPSEPPPAMPAEGVGGGESQDPGKPPAFGYR